MRITALAGLLLAAGVVCRAGAAEPVKAQAAEAAETAERAGTCEEAKTQQKYWCEERQRVTVIQTGLECENAKRNVLEACEGKKGKDHTYQ